MFESRTRTSKLLFHDYEGGEGRGGIAINARKGYEKKMQLRSGEWKMKDKNEITNRRRGKGEKGGSGSWIFRNRLTERRLFSRWSDSRVNFVEFVRESKADLLVKRKK